MLNFNVNDKTGAINVHFWLGYNDSEVDDSDLHNLEEQIVQARWESSIIKQRNTENSNVFIRNTLQEMLEYLEKQKQWMDSVSGPIPEEENAPPRTTWRQGMIDGMELMNGPIIRRLKELQALQNG